jgi:formylglycine-generating enzyme required for sulfatase activity
VNEDTFTDADASADLDATADARLDARDGNDIAPEPSPAVTVTAPEAGEYELGSRLTVIWNARNAETATLALVERGWCEAGATGVIVPSIASLAASSGGYAWTVPVSIAPGDYQVRLIVEADGQQAVGCSAVFSLVGAPDCGFLTCKDDNRSCIEVSGVAECGACLVGFEEADGICVEVDCGAAPAPPTNTQFESVTTTLFAGVANYICIEGHSTSGLIGGGADVTRRCGADGAWEAASAECLPFDCGASPAPAPNARASGVDRTTFGGTASYVCDDGYRVTGRPETTYSVRCGADGTWSLGATCEEAAVCELLTAPANGSVSTPEGTIEGASAIYNCFAGYALTGPATRICEASGAWSGSAPGCAETSCGAVATVAHATAFVPNFTLGSTATFTCEPGYAQRSGTANTQTCDGTNWSWTGSALVCDPVSCGALPNPANGRVTTPTGTEFNDVATYTCNSGYTRASGSATRTCQATATWSGSAAVCGLIDCGAPPPITNGSRSFTTTTFTSTANYSCNSGYRAPVPARLTCGATGSWGTAPTCSDIDECTDESVCSAVGNVCTNTTGSWQCSCLDAGYTGTPVTGDNAICVTRPGGELGDPCNSDSDCPANTWCSTVPGYRRCSPRVFPGRPRQMDFVFIPSGSFLQGTPGATDSHRPYTATISRNYFVGRTEVTQGQWKAATGGTNPARFQAPDGACSDANCRNDAPVELVDWYSAVAYANWVSSSQGLTPCYTLRGCSDPLRGWYDGSHDDCTGATFIGLTCTGYRLPTESEWERAARGGTTSTYFWGEASDVATVALYAWVNFTSNGRTEAVSEKLMNPYGLFDTCGNVREWVLDWFAAAYPIDSATDYTGPSSGINRSARGGSWRAFEGSAGRTQIPPRGVGRIGDDDLGFRLARTLN